MDIEIKNGDYGVSYAIKRQLKEEGVNTSNINSCWTEIMNAFKGDNESKVNDKTIGEQWNTLKANVQMQVGQVVKIAEATWNKIKDIVSKAAGNANGSGAADNGANDSGTTVKKSDCQTTNCKSVYYHKATDTYYKEVNGKLVKVKSRTGYHVENFQDDGSHWESGKTKKGTTTNIRVGSDNKKRYAYEDNAQGDHTVYTTYDDKEKRNYTNKYKNSILVSQRNHKTGKTYTFTDTGKRTSKGQYILKCSDGDYVLFSKYNCICDENGNPTE